MTWNLVTSYLILFSRLDSFATLELVHLCPPLTYLSSLAYFVSFLLASFINCLHYFPSVDAIT